MKKISPNGIGSISIFLWGTLALLTQFSGTDVPPFQLLSITFFIAFLLLSIKWWFQGHLGFRHFKQPLLAWFIGVGGYFGYHFCYFLAMRKAPAVEVSLLAYLWPLLIVFLSALLPNERLKIQHVIGAILALGGCWLLISQGGLSFNLEYLDGYLLALGCAFFWASYSVAMRLVKDVSTDTVGWFCLVTAILGFFCHLFFEETVWPQTNSQWLGIIGLGIGPVGIAFIAWDYAIKNGNIQILGVMAYAAPLISVLLLVITGFAEASYNLLFASIAIILGAYVASKK